MQFVEEVGIDAHDVEFLKIELKLTSDNGLLCLYPLLKGILTNVMIE